VSANARGYLPPDLAGRDVRYCFLGDVAGTQPPLTQPLCTGLDTLYVAACRRAGARSCTVGQDLTGGQRPLATLPVPAVSVPKIEWQGTCRTTTSIPSLRLFAPDSAALSGDADAVLRPIAGKVDASQASKDKAGAWIIAAIIGQTFDAGPGDGVALSRQRAQAVRERLVALGVDPGLIEKVDGVGESRPAVPTYLPDGRPDPAAPGRDRRVEVVLQLVQCPQA